MSPTTPHDVAGTVCVCDHAIEEHGHDPRYPGSTSCREDDCDCIAFEMAQNDDDSFTGASGRDGA